MRGMRKRKQEMEKNGAEKRKRNRYNTNKYERQTKSMKNTRRQKRK